MSRRRPARPLATIVLANLARSARRAAPVLRRGAPIVRRGAAWSLKATRCGLRATATGARRHRAVIGALGLRLAWWSALALLVIGGRAILGMGALPERSGALAPFAAGLLLCAAVRLLAVLGRLRLAALGLGALHGTALALVWTAFAG